MDCMCVCVLRVVQSVCVCVCVCVCVFDTAYMYNVSICVLRLHSSAADVDEHGANCTASILDVHVDTRVTLT